MSTQQIAHDDEVAAALAAVALLLAEEDRSFQEQPEPSRWNDATRLITQRMRPARVGQRPRWNTIERLRGTSGGGFGGVVGV